MLNVGDKVILNNESGYTRKAGMSRGEVYIVSFVEGNCIKVEGFLYYHDIGRFKLKKGELEGVEDF